MYEARLINPGLLDQPSDSDDLPASGSDTESDDVESGFYSPSMSVVSNDCRVVMFSRQHQRYVDIYKGMPEEWKKYWHETERFRLNLDASGQVPGMPMSPDMHLMLFLAQAREYERLFAKEHKESGDENLLAMFIEHHQNRFRTFFKSFTLVSLEEKSVEKVREQFWELLFRDVRQRLYVKNNQQNLKVTLICLVLLAVVSLTSIFLVMAAGSTIIFALSVVWPFAVSVAAAVLVYSLGSGLINYFNAKNDACEATASFFQPAKQEAKPAASAQSLTIEALSDAVADDLIAESLKTLAAEEKVQERSPKKLSLS